MAEAVQVVDLRASPTTGSRSRRSSLRKRHSDTPQSQPTRGRTMSSASETRRPTAVPVRPQSTSRTAPLPPPPQISAARASTSVSAPALRPAYTRRVPVSSAPATIGVAGPPNQVHVQRRGSTATGAFVSKPDLGRPRRSSSAPRHTPAITPTTPTKSLPVTSSNVRGRGRTPNEHVMYIPSGRPLIIVDERRNKNTPLPTVIRDGKVIMGGDGRSRAQLIDNAHTIVRSDPGTTARNGGTRRRGSTVVTRNVPQSRFTEMDASQPRSRRQSLDAGHGNVAGAPLERSRTWGHTEKREPPFGHHDFRCRPPWHGWKDWWMGVFMLNGRRRMQGNARYEDAHRERDLERRKREREFRTNVAAWRKGRRDVHLW